jgi:hypothetical protein
VSLGTWLESKSSDLGTWLAAAAENRVPKSEDLDSSSMPVPKDTLIIPENSCFRTYFSITEEAIDPVLNVRLPLTTVFGETLEEPC